MYSSSSIPIPPYRVHTSHRILRCWIFGERVFDITVWTLNSIERISIPLGQLDILEQPQGQIRLQFKGIVGESPSIAYNRTFHSRCWCKNDQMLSAAQFLLRLSTRSLACSFLRKWEVLGAISCEWIRSTAMQWKLIDRKDESIIESLIPLLV